MGSQKLFKYYQGKPVYCKFIREKAKELVGEPITKTFIEAEDLEYGALDILFSLKRLNTYIEKNTPVTDKGIIDTSDDCTIIKLQIQNDIVDFIQNAGYNVIAVEGGIKLKRSK